jgi:hypothetical protein
MTEDHQLRPEPRNLRRFDVRRPTQSSRGHGRRLWGRSRRRRIYVPTAVRVSVGGHAPHPRFATCATARVAHAQTPRTTGVTAVLCRESRSEHLLVQTHPRPPAECDRPPAKARVIATPRLRSRRRAAPDYRFDPSGVVSPEHRNGDDPMPGSPAPPRSLCHSVDGDRHPHRCPGMHLGVRGGRSSFARTARLSRRPRRR